MKKYIAATVGTVLGVTAIVAVSIFVPAARSLIGNNPYIVWNANTNSSFQTNGFNPFAAPRSSASFKEALLGTNKINHGNYVLYVGSLAYSSNIYFLLGTKPNGNSYLDSDLASNVSYPFNGSYGKAIAYQTSHQSLFSVQPTYVAYLNLLTSSDKRAYDAYNAMVTQYKNEVIPSDASETQIQTINKQKTWATSAPSFSFLPGATYQNYLGKTVPFINSQQNTDFLNLVTFMQSKFPNMLNLNSSPGFVIGYKNAKPVSVYSESFKTPEKKTTTSTPSSSSSIKLATTKTLTFSSSTTGTPQLAPTSNFYQWLVTNYGMPKK